MALPVTITGISTAVAPVGPFKASVPTTYLSQATSVTTANMGGVNTTAKAGQSFLASDNWSVEFVTLDLLKVGSPTDNVICELWSTSSNLPSTLLATATNTIAGGTLTGTAQSVQFVFSPVQLVAGTTYAIVINRSTGLDASNYYRTSLTTADPYASGISLRYNSTTGTWASSVTDWKFSVGGFTNAYYFFGRDGTTATTLQAYKSTAPDTSWASIATRTGFTTAILNIAGYQVGNVIHLLVQDGTLATSVATKYLSFDAATDTFLTTTETVVAASSIAGQATSGWGCSLVYRPTAGEVVAFYNTTATNTSGTPRSRLSYRRRTGVNTYQTAVQVDPNTATESTQPIAVLGASDRVHLLFFNGTNTMQRHLTSANVLGTAASTGATTAVQDACSYDDAGTIRHVGFTAAQSIRWASADNPTVTAATVTFGTPVRVADDGTDVYALYQNSADSDLYTKKSTDNGATFGSAVSAFVGTVTAAAASVSKNQLIYQRGNFVFPYLVNDGGSTWKYNEYTVRSVSTNKTLDATVGASYAVTGATTTLLLLKRKIDATATTAYTLTGTDVAISKAAPPKRLTADPGSYLLTGASTTTILRRARIDATAASYALTGASTTTALHKSKIDATVGGTYALTGTPASLLHKYRPQALGGSYLLTGTDAALTKTAALVNKTLPAGAASYALTGTDAAVIKRVFKRLTADGASYAVTGAATSAVLVKRKLTADAGTYALTGTAATPWHGYRVIAGASSYALTGNATAVLLHRWKVAATGGSYSLVGNSATFLIHKDIVSAAPGVYALTGAVVNFQIRSDKFVSAASGVYALTGTPAGVRKTWKHAATAGSYALTGNPATALTKLSQRTLAAASGSYALSGTAASVLHRWKTAALGSSYALTGSPATVVHRFKIAAASASYSLTGTVATVTKVAARTVTAAPGAYALTGATASTLHRAKLPATAGSYSLTGSPATVRYGYKVPAGASSYALTGAAATFPRTRRLIATGGTYALTGKPALVLYRWTFPAAGSSYTITGTPATLQRAKKVQAAATSYALTGSVAYVTQVRLLFLEAETASYRLTGNVARIFGGEWGISDRTVLAVAEDRRVAVVAETRSVNAVAETRLVRVLAELRSVSAPEEFRTIQARGENHGVSTMATQGPRRGPRLQHRLVAPAD